MIFKNKAFIGTIAILCSFIYSDMSYALNSILDGFRARSTNSVIEMSGYCENVRSTGGRDVFIPTRTIPEWLSFVNNKPSDVTMNSCYACNLPWGGTIGHGTTVPAYASASVPNGSSCVLQNRSCNNGSLSGSYTARFCEPTCPFNAVGLPTNTTYRCYCSSSDISTVGNLWGTMTYLEYSLICRSARHAGFVPSTGGYVQFRTQGAQSFYSSSTRNGIYSRSYGYWPRSFVFENYTIPNIIPVITLTGPSSISLYVGDTYTEQGATANDAEDGNITGSIVVGGNTVNTNSVGTYTVTYNVTDSGGASALQVTRTVTVNPLYSWVSGSYGSCSASPYWSGYGAWGSCNVSCGSGSEFRYRSCLNTSGTETRTVYCRRNTDNVTVSDTLCGGGKPSTTRSCTQGCSGSSSESRSCYAGACPTGPYTLGSWSTCSASCGGGTQTRSVSCNYSGGCYGESNTSRSCNTQSCPTGPYTLGSWSICSATCGGGTQIRSVSCNYSGGCYGESNTSRSCNTQSCPVACNNIFNYGGCELFVSPLGGTTPSGSTRAIAGNPGSYHDDWGGGSSATCNNGSWSVSGGFCVSAQTYASPTWPSGSGTATGRRVSTSAATTYCQNRGFSSVAQSTPTNLAGQNVYACWSTTGCLNCATQTDCWAILGIVCRN